LFHCYFYRFLFRKGYFCASYLIKLPSVDKVLQKTVLVPYGYTFGCSINTIKGV
jgi:hypothetical protein